MEFLTISEFDLASDHSLSLVFSRRSTRRRGRTSRSRSGRLEEGGGSHDGSGGGDRDSSVGRKAAGNPSLYTSYTSCEISCSTALYMYTIY